MIDHRLSLAAALALATLIQPCPASAQTDPMRQAYLSASNQMGVMEYCMSHGWADQAAVDAQKKSYASLPAATDPAGLSDAESTGRKGDLLSNGTTLSMASMASKGNTTEQDLCTRMASSAKMVAAQQSSMPKFPTMPGGAAMPSLSPGMTMPTMPGMPAMPKTQ